MSRFYRSAIIAVAVLAFALLGGALLSGTDATSATAAGPASCMGLEASDISPPGSNPEAPAGMPDLLAFVDSTGAPNRGAVISSLARLHEGSHQACDAAVE